MNTTVLCSKQTNKTSGSDHYTLMQDTNKETKLVADHYTLMQDTNKITKLVDEHNSLMQQTNKQN